MNASLTASDVMDRFGAADLSCLVTLRVALAVADDAGWASWQGLASEVEEEYRRLEAGPGDAIGDLTAPWDAIDQDGDTLMRYLEDHVIRRLSAEGIVEPGYGPRESTESPAETPLGIRITPEWLGRRESALASVDERIRELLEGGATASEPAFERAPGGSTLAATDLVKMYRKRRVVNEVDLHVSQGEIVGLLGPNGAGKTTTFYMMVGLIAPDSGEVFIGDETVTDVPMYRRARKGIGYLAQEPSIFRKLTVEENILAILQMLSLSKSEQKERLETLLDELGIKHLRKSKAYSLSGGERRRLEITRALVGQPKFMLLDEPFAGVDPIAVHDIQQIVAGLRQRNIGVLISDHNVEQTLDIVDRAYIMYDGRVRVSGTVSELVWNEEVAEIYLGPTLTARMRQRYPSE
ncbi:MAG TPA: LPS export ABC transporter ATP-binding protein [Longimicrobiaceae bacterium]|nr:LPS export ABC transporter ATP-binding protein [Longimicrobiaceae bacterium]